MQFKTVSIVKFTPAVTWEAMLNHMPQIAEGVDDLESIVEKEKAVLSPELTKVVNLWQAKPNLPQLIAKHIKPDMLIWTDTAIWNGEKQTVAWTIQSHYFGDQMHCSGTTTFEPAMGGKGCRLTFGGELNWKAGSVSLGFGFLDGALLKTAESVLTQMIPANFRKITEALADYILHHPVTAPSK